MNGLFVERRQLEGTSVSRDIAHHLYTRQFPGSIVVVTDKPGVLLASISKQWAKVVRQVQRERASTLNPARMQELERVLMHMQTLRFSAKEIPQCEGTAVLLSSATSLLLSPPNCHTLYVLRTEPEELMLAITAAMPAHGLVVIYE